jgi:hypothetical protein
LSKSEQVIGGAEILSRLGGALQQSQPAPEKPRAEAPEPCMSQLGRCC